MIIFHKLKKLYSYHKQHGLKSAFWFALGKIKTSSPAQIFSKVDVIGFYSFVNQQSYGDPEGLRELSPKTINWFIPPFGHGSGGHLNIFRFVSGLEKRGFKCNIIIIGEPKPISTEIAKSQICNWFFPINGAVFIGTKNAPAANISVATSWQTAYAVNGFLGTKRKFYFVQDFEPWFFAVGSEFIFAEQTYRLGLEGITAGGWLSQKLSDEYGMICNSVGFSYDHDRYKPHHRREPEIKRVFFYARPPTQRRAFELGMLVLNELTKRNKEIKVIFAGWDLSSYEIPFEHLNAGILSLDQLPDLYSQCDAALVLSFSNLSLLPLELMACGVPVVSNRGPWVEWLLNNENSILVDPNVQELTNALEEVLKNDDLRCKLSSEGLKFARNTSWEKEIDNMSDIFNCRGASNA